MKNVVDDAFDAAIVGGGPAGLSAALLLGRCRRRVLVIDDGRRRNAASRTLHCLLGQEGSDPSALIAKGRAELENYQTVELISATVTQIRKRGAVFEVHYGDTRTTARKLVLATGIEDELPNIKGIDRFYGVSVHHCPYCDAYEHRDRPIAVYGLGDKGAELALLMKHWSAKVFLCTDGRANIPSEIESPLREHQIAVHSEPIAELEGTEDGHLRGIKLSNGERLECSCLFFATSSRQRSDLSAALGCERDEKGGIVSDPVTGDSSVRGVFVAGDASRDVLLVSVAIAEGAQAGVAVNRALLREEELLT